MRCSVQIYIFIGLLIICLLMLWPTNKQSME